MTDVDFFMRVFIVLGTGTAISFCHRNEAPTVSCQTKPIMRLSEYDIRQLSHSDRVKYIAGNQAIIKENIKCLREKYDKR